MGNLANKYLPAKRGRKAGGSCELTRQRRTVVLKALLKGTDRQKLITDIMTSHGVSEAQINQDIVIVNAKLREEYQHKQSDLIAFNHARMEALYEQWDALDGNLQLKIIQEQHKVAGVYKPESQVQVNTLNVNLENLSVEELKQLLNAAK